MDNFALMEEDRHIQEKMVKYMVNENYEKKKKSEFLEPEFV